MGYRFDSFKVLIVDDVTPMVTLVSSLFDIFGCRTILTASDADDAFAKFCQYDPDLVLTDWLSHPMDGLLPTRHMRQHGGSPNRFVPIIMMTGFSHPNRVETARDTGVTEFMVKPFKIDDLSRRIEQAVEKPRKFIEAERFFGPDRRRRKAPDDLATRRRTADFMASGSKIPMQRRSAQFKVHEPPNILRQKLGMGGMDPAMIQRAEQHIRTNTLDFLPAAQRMVEDIEILMAQIATNPEDKRTLIAKIIMAIMKLKANASMFGYDVIARISDVLLTFMESIRFVDHDVLAVLTVYHGALKALISNGIKGDGGPIGVVLAKEMESACLRYHKKYKLEDA